LHLISANRRLLVALGSGGALALGLLLLHVPRLRSAGVLLALAVVLAAFGFVAPDLALLIGQWSVLGGVVALAATAWTWLGWGRVSWMKPVASTASPRPRESTLSHAPTVRPERSTPLSTATAPAGAAAEVRQ
jgi:hypothetical protein